MKIVYFYVNSALSEERVNQVADDVKAIYGVSAITTITHPTNPNLCNAFAARIDEDYMLHPAFENINLINGVILAEIAQENVLHV